MARSQNIGLITMARIDFHSALLAGVLHQAGGIPANADGSSKHSVSLAQAILEKIGDASATKKLAGQTSGARFEKIVADFLEATFLKLGHLRPGAWRILSGGGKEAAIENYEQFAHLADLAQASATNDKLAAILGNDYTIKPDVLIVRGTESDPLHASISCKWTMRSDRAQNARTEALNLIRNRRQAPAYRRGYRRAHSRAPCFDCAWSARFQTLAECDV